MQPSDHKVHKKDKTTFLKVSNCKLVRKQSHTANMNARFRSSRRMSTDFKNNTGVEARQIPP